MQSTLLSDLLRLAIIEAEKSNNFEHFSQSEILQPFLNSQIKALNVRLAQLEINLEENQSKSKALLLFIKTAEEYKKQSLLPELQESLAQVEIAQRKALKRYKQHLLTICKLESSIAGIKAEISYVKNQK